MRRAAATRRRVTRTFTSSAKRADITDPSAAQERGALATGLGGGRRGDGRRPLGRAPHSRARAGFRSTTVSERSGTSHILWAGVVMTDYQSVALPLSYGPQKEPTGFEPASSICLGARYSRAGWHQQAILVETRMTDVEQRTIDWLRPPRQRVTWGFAGIEPAVWAAGFEPATSRLRTELSATLRYTQKIRENAIANRRFTMHLLE